MSLNDTTTAFKVGDKVEGLYAAIVDYYKNKVAVVEHAKWYPGKISSIHPGEGSESHLFEIEYNDGDRQTAIPARFIRLKGAIDGSPRSSSSSIAKRGEFTIGSKIEGIENKLESLLLFSFLTTIDTVFILRFF